jgi:predicted outer membrane repeat protein
LNNEQVNLTTTQVTKNYASSSGGGIFCSDSELVLSFALISENTGPLDQTNNNLYCSPNPIGTFCDSMSHCFHLTIVLTFSYIFIPTQKYKLMNGLMDTFFEFFFHFLKCTVRGDVQWAGLCQSVIPGSSLFFFSFEFIEMISPF